MKHIAKLRKEQRGGISILAKENLTLTEIKTENEFLLPVIKSLGNSQVIVIAIYIMPSESEAKKQKSRKNL